MNGTTPRIEHQITRLRPTRSPIGPPHEGADRGRGQEGEQTELRILRRQPEAMHQIEDEVAGDAGQIEILRENQRDQHGDGAPHLPGGNAPSQQPTTFVPAAAPSAYKRTRPTSRSPFRPRRTPQTMPGSPVRKATRPMPPSTAPANCRHCRQPGTTIGRNRGRRPRQGGRCARLPDGRSPRRGRAEPRAQVSTRKLGANASFVSTLTSQLAAHAEGQRIRLRMLIGVEPERPGCNSDAMPWKTSVRRPICPEAETVSALEQWIDRNHQRTRKIVEQMAEGDRPEDRESPVAPASFGRLRHQSRVNEFLLCVADSRPRQRNILWVNVRSSRCHKSTSALTGSERAIPFCIAPMRM